MAHARIQHTATLRVALRLGVRATASCAMTDDIVMDGGAGQRISGIVWGL